MKRATFNTAAWALAIVLSSTPALSQEPLKKKWVTGSPKFTEGAATIAVLPDTEYYSWKYPELFHAQTKWIADEAKRRNIVYTIHLGDITQHNNKQQWTVARDSFARLDDKVPFALAPGNDDYDNLVGGDWNRLRNSSKINQFFPPSQFAQWPTFGGFYQDKRMENTYHLFRMHNQDWIIVCLEMGARDEVLQWAGKILSRERTRRAIVVTHAYLFRNNKRYDHRNGRERASPHPWGNDGEMMWQKLIRKHANVMIVMSGHVSTGGLGYRTDKGDHGNVVHQMMCDYQKKEKGGLAYMRLLEFAPDGKTVHVRTYSPYRNKIQISDLEWFSFQLQFP